MSNVFDFEVAGNPADPYEFSADDSVHINDYMKSVLERCKAAADMELWDEAVDDAITATKLGVSNDADYQIFHYIDTFVEDIVDEIFGQKLDDAEEDELKQFLFSLKDEVDFSNLAAFWVGVIKWLESRKKKAVAYPNRGDTSGARYVKLNNLAAWANLAYHVQRQIAKGILPEQAISHAASLLHPLERLDFKAWYRFRFGKNNNLYDVNKSITDKSEGTMNIRRSANSKFAYVHEEGGRYYLPDFSSPFHEMSAKDPVPQETPEDLLEKEKKREKFEEARSKLVSRTFAIDKLLERFYDVISDDAVSDIEDAVNSLRKKIRQLKCATIIRDTVIKTANMMKTKGFSTGHKYLLASASEFMGEEQSIEKVAFSMGDVGEMLQKLQDLSNQLKRRDMVREIAKIDFKLHEMNASALFPELSEAQAKLIDATTYAANKLEDVIPKLRTINKQPGPGAVQPGRPGPGAPPLMKADKPEAGAPTLTAPPSPSPAAPAPAPAPEKAKSEGISELEKAI